MHVRRDPMAAPSTGVAQLPRVTPGADGQEIVPALQRTSYVAGNPVPSFASVKDNVTDESVAPATARSVTLPGFVAVTLIAALPLTPSLLAKIAADPVATLFSRPLALTVAIAGLLDVQVTARPVIIAAGVFEHRAELLGRARQLTDAAW